MNIKKFGTSALIALLGVLSTFIFVMSVQAANRNDALYDLKDTFNSPIGQKVSGITLVLIIISVVIIVMIFRYNSSREERAQREALKSYRERHRSQSADQKRGWFRLKTDAEFRWIPAHQADKAKLSQYNVDQLIDISGGGLSFSTLEILKAEDEINMILPTGGSNPLNVDGRVIRAVKGDDAYNISIQFIGLLGGQRDKLVAWIQNNQRTAMFFEKHQDFEEESSEDTNETDDEV